MTRFLLVLPLVSILAACGGSAPVDGVALAGGRADCPQTLTLAEFEGVAATAAEGVVLPPGEQAEHPFEVADGCPLLDVTVTLRWDLEAEDLDLEVLDPSGAVVASSGNFNLLEGAAIEIAMIGAPAPGTYTVRVNSYLNVETPYTVSVEGRASDGQPLPVADLSGVAAGPQPRTVVAVIDSGINPYHAYFHAGSPIYPDTAPASVTRDVLAEFGVLPQCVIELTRSGDFEADFAADTSRGEWDKASACELVWFKGTNLLARSFGGGSRVIQPDDEGDTHGVGTSAAVLAANPEAIVLFLEGISDGAEEFAFTHPAVDFVSTSYGPIGSVPLPGNLSFSYPGVFGNGKLHFGACDNTPSPCVQDSTGGPWWSIGVAGFEETNANEPETSSSGRQPVSGTLPDFLGDFTQTLPYCAACEDGYDDFVGGTSFATPRSAGTASRILLEARRARSHLRGIDTTVSPPAMVSGEGGFTNWALRRALETAAWVPGPEGYDPAAAAVEFGPGVPIPPLAPWTLIGWGVISPLPEAGVIDGALAFLGFGGEAPGKDAGFCTFQTEVMALRKAYWDFGNIESESYLNPPDPDPYLPC